MAAPVAAEVGRESPRSRPSSPVTNAEEAVDDGHDDDTAVEMRSRLTSMHARYGTQLNFLVVEFTKMEVQLSLEVGSTVIKCCVLVVARVGGFATLFLSCTSCQQVILLFPSFSCLVSS